MGFYQFREVFDLIGSTSLLGLVYRSILDPIRPIDQSNPVSRTLITSSNLNVIQVQGSKYIFLSSLGAKGKKYKY